jgi:hypothetical protein
LWYRWETRRQTEKANSQPVVSEETGLLGSKRINKGKIIIILEEPLYAAKGD